MRRRSLKKPRLTYDQYQELFIRGDWVPSVLNDLWLPPQCHHHSWRQVPWAKNHRYSDGLFAFSMGIKKRCRNVAMVKCGANHWWCAKHIKDQPLPQDPKAEELHRRPYPTHGTYCLSTAGSAGREDWPTQYALERAGVDRELLWRELLNGNITFFTRPADGPWPCRGLYHFDPEKVEGLLASQALTVETHLGRVEDCTRLGG